MAGSFDFIRDKFPEISEDAEKAESYLHTDNAACVFYISRVFDGALKTLCRCNNISLIADGRERTSSDLIDELKQKKIAGGKILRILHSMRMFRNKNAHNEDTSQKDSAMLLKKAKTLCKWLMENYGEYDLPGTDNETPTHITISLTDLMTEYERNPSATDKKYKGKRMTITGGRVFKVERSGSFEGGFVVSLLSRPSDKSAVIRTVHKVDCYFPARMEDKLANLKPGRNFTATGTWQGKKLTNCVWKAEGKRRNFFRRGNFTHGTTSWGMRVLRLAVVLAIMAFIMTILGKN
ncbi:MAG: DUF4145 domain-containing protein [Synergistaceae bacterium]|nr:DUF4145 domain-containing protein [Synergistaceae bacterium]MBR0258491.1 DUF4145 domain-containing protein [Synergistaceae bacterium]